MHRFRMNCVLESCTASSAVLGEAPARTLFTIASYSATVPSRERTYITLRGGLGAVSDAVAAMGVTGSVAGVLLAAGGAVDVVRGMQRQHYV